MVEGLFSSLENERTDEACRMKVHMSWTASSGFATQLSGIQHGAVAGQQTFGQVKNAESVPS